MIWARQAVYSPHCIQQRVNKSIFNKKSFYVCSIHCETGGELHNIDGIQCVVVTELDWQKCNDLICTVVQWVGTEVNFALWIKCIPPPPHSLITEWHG